MASKEVEIRLPAEFPLEYIFDERPCRKKADICFVLSQK